ncbi:MAG: HAMP domain-containing protein [Nitrospirae bacterium]|nr:HAMP domain-containing protein [Nitrospirota bacterium]
MKLLFKIIGISCVISLFAGIAVFSGIHTINLLKNDFAQVIDGSLPKIDLLEKLRFAAIRIVSSTNELGLILTEKRNLKKTEKKEQAEETEEKNIDSGKKLYEKTFKSYESLINATAPEEKDNTKKLKSYGINLIDLSDRLIELKMRNVKGADILKIREEFEGAEKQFLAALEAVLKKEELHLADRKSEVESASKNAITTILSVSAIAFILAMLSSIIMSGFVTRPVNKLRQAVFRIGQGDFDIAVDIKSKDEIGELAASFNKMACYLRNSRNELTSVTEKLRQSNKELQDFIFIASHDLQEPLRKVMIFGERLKRAYHGTLDEQGRTYIKKMQDATRRMQTLLNDLVSFLRVTVHARPFAAVDLSNVAEKVTADMKMRIEQAGGHIEVEQLDALDADTSQMRQLFHNLIDNSLKFRKKDAPPFIRISGKHIRNNENAQSDLTNDGRFYQIIFEDNGMGFDEKYAERIFGVFQKLHGRKEYEGTGMGLSVCKKIVERHGGAITAKGAPEKGATFIITMPVSQPARSSEDSVTF